MSKKRVVKAILVKNLLPTLSYTGRPTTVKQQYEVSHAMARGIMKKGLVGKPVRFEHAISNPDVEAGRVIASEIIGDTWWADLEIDNSLAHGQLASRLIDHGVLPGKPLRGVSLHHIDHGPGNQIPVEVTLCWQGARPGSGLVMNPAEYNQNVASLNQLSGIRAVSVMASANNPSGGTEPQTTGSSLPRAPNGRWLPHTAAPSTGGEGAGGGAVQQPQEQQQQQQQQPTGTQQQQQQQVDEKTLSHPVDPNDFKAILNNIQRSMAGMDPAIRDKFADLAEPLLNLAATSHEKREAAEKLAAEMKAQLDRTAQDMQQTHASSWQMLIKALQQSADLPSETASELGPLKEWGEKNPEQRNALAQAAFPIAVAASRAQMQRALAMEQGRGQQPVAAAPAASPVTQKFLGSIDSLLSRYQNAGPAGQHAIPVAASAHGMKRSLETMSRDNEASAGKRVNSAGWTDVLDGPLDMKSLAKYQKDLYQSRAF